MTRAAIVMFPGVNCERETARALERAFGGRPVFVDAGAQALPADTALVVLPGGFSYGDHLRSGAIAARAPVMAAVRAHAEAGGLTLGICNGFQVLAEAGLLPGGLATNASGRFVHRLAEVEVVSNRSPFLRPYRVGERIKLPIAHHQGAWTADDATRRKVVAEDALALRYVGANPNGSTDAVAGLTDARGAVLGLMPHPERVDGALRGHGDDGARLFAAAAAACAEAVARAA